jgi:hypothetical protein
VRARWRLVALVLLVGLGCSGSTGGTSTPAEPAPPAPTVRASTTSTSTVPTQVSDLITATTMTERARRLFLAANPQVQDAATFARSCSLEGPTSAASPHPNSQTHGCYVNGRIYLLAFERAEVHDLMYVVAAHELLHAVYAQLPPGERSSLDAQLEAARAGNTRLEERLKAYDPGPTILNEVHSILGSELEGLTPALEAHYATFFADRRTVLAARQRTLGSREDDLARRKAAVADLDARIEDLKDRQAALLSAGSIRSYNANVPVINGLIDDYNTQVAELNQHIEEYNTLLAG